MTEDPWANGITPAPTHPIAAVLVTSDYRGDHAADVQVAVSATREDTLGDLIERSGLTRSEDHIAIRLVTK